MFDLRQLLTGAVIRAIAGIRDVGEIFESIVGSDSHSEPVMKDDEDTATIWTASKHTLSDQEHISRTYSPGSMLWRTPRKGDRVLVIRPQHVDGPGVTWMLHSAGGNTNSYPDWLDDNNSGLSCPEDLHLESTDGNVLIEANTGQGNGNSGPQIVLNDDGSLNITADQTGTTSIDIDADGKISITPAPGKDIVLEASGTGSVQVTATPITGAVKLGPVGSLAVLVQGAMDSMGVPVQQAPAAAATIVKAG